jgi:hypothetical protein
MPRSRRSTPKTTHAVSTSVPPSQLLASIERTWGVTQTSKRIVEDIELQPEVLSKFIEACGCVVQDEKCRGLMEMSSTVPHTEEIAETKQMIRSGALRADFDGRPLTGLSICDVNGVDYQCICLSQCFKAKSSF